MSYKCISCGTIKKVGELYHQVRIITGDGQTLYSPACCEICAKEAQEKYVNLHKERMESVLNQCFQIMKWKDFN